MYKVYVSGALTGISNPQPVKSLYELLAATCKSLGISAYLPHLATDPITHAHVSPQQVYETDKAQVCQSDLVIAYLGYPSFGVGMELAYADSKGIPIILLYEQGKQVSRFPRGIPNVIAEIMFLDNEDIVAQLQPILEDWLERSH